jgi:cytoplasmic tRNA 2-thiolation protein 1
MRFKGSAEGAMPQPGKCEECGYISSQRICKACVLLAGLNQGLPNLGISRTRAKPRSGSKAGLPKPLENGKDDADDGGVRVKGVPTHRGSVSIAYEA